MIIYRDTSSPPSPRLPPWLDGAADVCRRESPKGDLVAITDPLVFPSGDGLAWTDLPDGWQVATSGRMDAAALIRRRTDCESLTVIDSHGVVWVVPAVLDPRGNVQMALPVRCISGIWKRAPTPEQESIIAAAQSARAEIVADRLGTVPLAAACSWAAIVLSACYHISPEAIGAVGILDDYLTTRTLLSAAGFPPEAG